MSLIFILRNNSNVGSLVGASQMGQLIYAAFALDFVSNVETKTNVGLQAMLNKKN
jgi:hypothetical protein